MTTRIPLRVSSSSAIPRKFSRISTQCLSQPGRISPQLRQYSTPAIETTPTTSSLPPPPPPAQPKPKRSLRPYIYATSFTILGIMAAQYVNLIIAPPPLPLPDTHEDKLMVEFLHKQGENLPIVKSLMGDPNWVHNEAYSGFGEEEKAHRFTTGPMGGARGIGGFHRVFYNEDTGEHICVVWIGGALAGWPGVTHGGVSATLMDESLGRCAIKLFPSKTGVTANLELNYMKPLITNSFYVIRTAPQKEGATNKKAWVSGRMETLDGRVCVEAKALFVVPKKYQTKAIPTI